jgi:Domain of unknown function (DUF4333)
MLLAGCAWSLTGCFTTSADYQRDAEEFILNDENLTEALGIGFTSATCEDPQSQDPGTTFICTAVDDADGDWEFEIEIQDSNGYDVNVSRRPPG